MYKRQEFDLVDCWNGLAGLVLEEDLEVLDGKVRDTDVLDTARRWELLQLSPAYANQYVLIDLLGPGKSDLPGVNEVPVLIVLLKVVRVSGGRPVLQCNVSFQRVDS